MTDLIDRADSGEIPPPPGEHRIRIDLGEKTQLIDPRLIKAPSFDAIPRKVIDIDDTVAYQLPPTVGIIPDLAGDPETERLTVLGSLAGVTARIDGEFEGPQKPVPVPKPPRPSAPGRDQRARFEARRMFRRGRHALPVSTLELVAYVALGVTAIWAGLTLAAVAVFL